MNKKRSISVVFPVYNEEDCVERAITYTISVLDRLTDDYEIIIVNDASTDNTKEIIENMASKNSHIRVIHHKKNMKLGGSLKTGFASAQKEFILYSDIDLPFDMNELEKSIRIMEFTDADVITAYRHNRYSEGFKRAIYSICYNFIIRVLFNLPIWDLNFSFKLLRKHIFDKITLKSNGSFIDAELLIRCYKSGFRIHQIGVDYFHRTRGGVSRLSSIGVILNILKEMFLLMRELNSIKPDHNKE